MKHFARRTHSDGVLFAFINTVCFGILGIFDKLGSVATKNSFLYATQSIFFAFCFTTAWYLFLYKKSAQKEFRSVTRTSWLQIILIGCFASGFFTVLRFTGLLQSTGTFATLSQAVTTSLTVLLAHFFLKEKLSKTAWGLFFLILSAMYVVSVGSFSLASIKSGDLYILSGTLFLAVSNIVTRRAVVKNNPVLVAVGRFFFGFIFLLLIYLLFFIQTSVYIFSFYSVLSGLFWAVNVILFNIALQKIGATLTTSILMIAPILTMVLEVTFLSYHFLPVQYIAAILVVLSGITLAIIQK